MVPELPFGPLGPGMPGVPRGPGGPAGPAGPGGPGSPWTITDPNSELVNTVNGRQSSLYTLVRFLKNCLNCKFAMVSFAPIYPAGLTDTASVSLDVYLLPDSMLV